MSDKVLDTLVAWGERTPEIRAMTVTSTRARPDGRVDEFSDYDVILAVCRVPGRRDRHHHRSVTAQEESGRLNLGVGEGLSFVTA